jgi:hypothetical protein
VGLIRSRLRYINTTIVPTRLPLRNQVEEHVSAFAIPVRVWARRRRCRAYSLVTVGRQYPLRPRLIFFVATLQTSPQSCRLRV